MRKAQQQTRALGLTKATKWSRARSLKRVMLTSRRHDEKSPATDPRIGAYQSYKVEPC